MKNLPRLVLLLFILGWGCASLAQNPDQSNRLAIGNERLIRLQKRFHDSQELKRQQAVDFARSRDLNTNKFYDGSKTLEIRKLSAQNTLLYYSTYNRDAAISSGAATLNSGGISNLNLNGQSMTLGIWEGDAIRSSHQELAGRVIIMDGTTFRNSNEATEHATHVAGTMIASGISPSAQGMAPEASLRAYDWNFDESEMASFGASGFLISNHSYGFCTEPGPETRGGCNWPDWRFGYYDDTAENWDEIAYNAPFYLIVKAAGNDRNDGKNTSQNGFDLLEGAGTAKNVLVVGAADDVPIYTGPESVDLASFSSVGPTDDGRIKPDLVGNGVNLFSSFSGSNFDYESISGTSMSSPNVSGSLILLQQHYNNLNDSYMRSATLRGLAIHTAREAGANPGPDYEFGWGLIDVESAANVISDNGESSSIEELILSDGQTLQKVVKASGLTPLTITISWTDPKGSPLPENSSSENVRTSLLLNDVDMSVSHDGTVYSPWILDPDNPSEPAANGDNFRDNVEKVEISNPESGEYTITINHKGFLNSGTQEFSLIISGIEPVTCEPTPPQNVTAGTITDETAILSWEPQLGISSYQGRFRELGTSEWMGFSSSSNSNFFLELRSGTVYETEIQSQCTTTDISDFSNTFLFQTDCRPDVPENLSFDDITTSSVHLDWDTVRAIEAYEVRYRLSGSREWQTMTTADSEMTLTDLSPGSLYDFQVSAQCSSELASDFSESLQFTPYCIAQGENSENEWIQKVQIGTITNESGNDNGYADYSMLETSVAIGTEVDIGLMSGEISNFPRFWTVWIDFNRDGNFAGSNEEVLSLPVDPGELTLSSISIPNNALNGKTLMRVAMKYNEAPGSCESFAYGETEDYTLNIQKDPLEVDFMPVNGSLSTQLQSVEGLTVYPNPSSERISINLSSEFNAYEIQLVDMSGNTLLALPFDSRMIINISQFKKGIYIARILAHEGVRTTRFVKN